MFTPLHMLTPLNARLSQRPSLLKVCGFITSLRIVMSVEFPLAVMVVVVKFPQLFLFSHFLTTPPLRMLILSGGFKTSAGVSHISSVCSPLVS